MESGEVMSFEGKRARALGLLLAAALVALGLVAATQAAGIRPSSTATASYVYWVQGGTSIGRANADGSGLNGNFLNTANNTDGVVANSQYVYWTNEGSQIGRANLDGSNPNQSFISGASFGNSSHPVGLAVDSQHIYWVNGGSIGRANLDGTNVDETFISGAGGDSVAVDGQHIYWDTGSCEIGRANLDGSGVDQTFVVFNGGGTEDCNSTGVAVDAQHIYWGHPSDASLGRANLDGSGINSNFINTAQTSGNVTTWSISAVAVDSQHIYWSGYYTIGRANLDGTGVDQGFLSNTALGIAVSPPITVPTTTTTTTTTGTTTPKPKAAVTVIVKVKGKGHVRGGGVLCPATCKATVYKGSPLTMRAHAARGYRFAGWSGACPSNLFGVGGCTLAVYLHSSHPRTQAKITGQSLWTAFATPNTAGAVTAKARFVRR